MDLISLGLTIIVFSLIPFAAGIILMIVRTAKQESPVQAFVIIFLSMMLLIAGGYMALLNSWSMFYIFVFLVLGLVLVRIFIWYMKQQTKDPEPEHRDRTAKITILRGPSSMNERVIIRSQMHSISRFRRICAVFCILLFAVLFYVFYLQYVPGRVSGWLEGGYYREYYDSMAACIFSGFVGAFTLSAVIALIPFGIFILVACMLSGTELVVTDKRIFYRGLLGRCVDLPLDTVSAICAGMLRSITISTPSGVIRAALLNNRDEVYNAVIDLLVSRLDRVAVAVNGPVMDVPAPAAAPEAQPVAAKAAVTAAAVPATPAVAKPAADHTVGRCMMCGKTDLPVKTIEFKVAGTVRKRTVCDECANSRK